MINGDLHMTQGRAAGRPRSWPRSAAAGIEVVSHDDLVTLDIPLVVAFGNPTCSSASASGPFRRALALGA